VPVTVHFYAIQDHNKLASPYLAHINLLQQRYRVPSKGTVQVTLFNPQEKVVKIFVVQYNLSDMPPSSETFLRQRTLLMPKGASDKDASSTKYLRYLIHLRFMSSKSGHIYLHKDIRAIIYYKSDLDAAASNSEMPYELKCIVQHPNEPRYSSRTIVKHKENVPNTLHTSATTA
jgi:hypothetical protein